MAKVKKDVEEQDTNVGGEEEAGAGMEGMDFDVSDEYKPDPLIPKCNYTGVVNSVKFVPSQYCILWNICLHDNGGAMTDGITAIDGAHVFFRNWLPKPGDETEMTKSGSNNKRQSKINMLKKFQDKMGIDMSTPAKITDALANQEWMGIEVIVEVQIDEYQGQFRNVVNDMRKSG